MSATVRLLAFLVWLGVAPVAWAVCPAATTDCPSPTYNALTAGSLVVKGNLTVQGAFVMPSVILQGTGTGYTTLGNLNTSATNYVVNFPAANDTALLAATVQTISNKSIAGSEINSGTVPGNYLAAINLAAGNVNGGVTGILPVANGGTGVSAISSITGLAWSQIGSTPTTLAGYGITSPLPVAQGGTNCSTASGTCVDNVSGFASTGIVNRTGAGAYSFLAAPAGTIVGTTDTQSLSNKTEVAPVFSGTITGTYTLGGTPSIAASALTGSSLPSGITGSSLTGLGTISSGAWQGTAVGLGYGGTAAALTASNGGIVYSGASALAILAGTATPGLPLLSGSSTAPSWGADVNLAYLDANQVYGKSQRVTAQTVSISTATFTPNFDTGADFSVTLVHASCPCTLANPSTTPVAGQHGVIYITQSATGSDTIGTWGSDFVYAGGTSTIALSAGAGDIDVFSYAVKDSTHIVLTLAAANVSH